MKQPLGGRAKRFSVVAVLFFLTAVALPAQITDLSLDEYYAYPFSAGAEFQTLTPLADYRVEVQATEIAVLGRLPIPGIPWFQPQVRLGTIIVDDIDRSDPDKEDFWDHQHLYGGVGAAAITKISKEFEFGADLFVGLSQGIFPNIDPVSGEPRGNLYFLAGLGGRINLSPTYNIGIEIYPNIKYLHSIGLPDFTRFNGLVFGVGFSATFRIGTDPDSITEFRSIGFSNSSVDTVFAAMQSYYVRNPVGSTTIRNVEEFPITDVAVSFFQENFMDAPTESAVIDVLEPGESVTVDLFAGFNNEVFSTEGVQPLTGEIIVNYVARGRPAEQRHSVSYDLQDRSALTWDDDRKVAAFITPRDGAMQNYASFVRRIIRDAEVDGLNERLQVAMGVYYALKEYGIFYQPDPTSPFTEVQENPFLVDSVSVPRDTLRRISGDCDDLSVLYATLLETVGIPTAIITAPGHVYVAFNTGLSADQYRLVHPNRDMTMIRDDEIWIPVEITLVGIAGFLEAWQTGLDLYRREAARDQAFFYKTAEAQSVYRPVGLVQSDAGIQYGEPENIIADFQTGLDRLVDAVIADYRRQAEESGNRRDYNSLGIAAAQFQRYDLAIDAFEQAFERDRNFVDAKINMGLVYSIKEEFQDALRNFHQAEAILVQRNRLRSRDYVDVVLNIAEAYYSLENYDRARDYFVRLEEADPEVASRNSYLGERAQAAN